MLLRYGGRNFYCFKEGVEISFELSSKCPKNISKGKPVASLICVKGANGSGKTNALKLISFIKQFCVNSFDLKPEESLKLKSYFNNPEPIDLYCEFKLGGIEYLYEATLTIDRIISETLSRTIKRAVVIFKREDNKLTKFINEFSDLEKMKLRSNASIISTANQYSIDEIKPIYHFFERITTNVNWMGRADFLPDYKMISKYYNDFPTTLDFSVNIIKKCDLGIRDIAIHQLEDEKGEVIYFPIFEHDAGIAPRKLTFFDQSSGTKELYTLLPFYENVLATGGVLVLDEFDSKLHPHMLPFLVKLFDNAKINHKNAQMIFTTHHDSIIDFMGKYRTILVNKEKGESYSYRLDEIPGDILRNDRPIGPIYNAGKVGGVPKI